MQYACIVPNHEKSTFFYASFCGHAWCTGHNESGPGYFRYKEYINWLQIDEILTYVFMYVVFPSRFCGAPVRCEPPKAPLKNDVTIFDQFWPENAFSPFSYTGGLLVCENEELNCFDIQCVVEASSSILNHNMTLEIKENYPQHTKTVQNSKFTRKNHCFMPEVKAFRPT